MWLIQIEDQLEWKVQDSLTNRYEVLMWPSAGIFGIVGLLCPRGFVFGGIYTECVSLRATFLDEEKKVQVFLRPDSHVS